MVKPLEMCLCTDLYVMMIGMMWMPMWFVNSLATQEELLQEVPTLEKLQMYLHMMMFSVQEERLVCRIVHIHNQITVMEMRLLELNAIRTNTILDFLIKISI